MRPDGRPRGPDTESRALAYLRKVGLLRISQQVTDPRPADLCGMQRYRTREVSNGTGGKPEEERHAVWKRGGGERGGEEGEDELRDSAAANL